jgi:hypothetical protein
MTVTETRAARSLGPQTFSTRWGDYSHMSVDPSDDTTFWFTSEVVDARGRWVTKIMSFALPP